MKAFFFSFSAGILFCAVSLCARDIDLDGIYLKKEFPIYSRICSSKESVYSDIDAKKISGQVIFCRWLSGSRVLYIAERRGLNYIYIYNTASGRNRQILRLRGAVSAAILSDTSRLLALKMLYYSKNIYPRAMDVYIDTETGRITTENSSQMFCDRSFVPGRDMILREKREGMVAYNPFRKDYRKIIDRREYRELSHSGSPVIAYLSPDRRKKILACGEGGSYKALFIKGRKRKRLRGVSSASDMGWLDNFRFIYRSGGPGAYSVKLYNSAAGNIHTLESGTMNPDINISRHPGIVTFLHDQIVTVYYAETGNKISTGIEGEEVYFSHDGSKFTSLYLGSLYIVKLSRLFRKKTEIRRRAAELHKLYSRALADRQSWQNNYSEQYIRRKISAYRKILNPGNN